VDQLLKEILSLKRPSVEPEEEARRTWLPRVLSWFAEPPLQLRDSTGHLKALLVTISGEGEKTLFCCHLDTVHDGNGMQRVVERDGLISTPNGECLGADDGAGIWLLLSLIAARVPGTYLFHADEEIGCLGSRWLAAFEPAWLCGFQRCISLDRPGMRNVVTHFCGQRGCSDAFASRLAGRLNAHLPGHALSPSDRGGLTDVIEYIGLIPEVTNIATGYLGQHGPQETLDANYLTGLRHALLSVFGCETDVRERHTRVRHFSL
jgi:hypothetical protein